jgi:acetoin utilization deacetylase AcuC-like enzyme
MKGTTGIYFHPETTMRSGGHEAPAKAVLEFIANRDHLSGASNISLRKTDITEFRSVHSDAYIDSLIRLSLREKPVIQPHLSHECIYLWDFLPGYCYGLGGLYHAIDLMKKGVLDRAYCFSLPGHHAYPDKGHGYCLLNSLAAAARYARQCGFRNILMIDWDFHHGDGTQTIFENDPSVYQISIHSAVDLYMGTQNAIKLGFTTYGERVGHCNIPVMNNNFGEKFYFETLAGEFSGKLYSDKNCIETFANALEELPFTPDLILIFDGHDSHIDDLGKDITNWDDQAFTKLAELAFETAGKHHCPVISSPGGGYHVETLFRLTDLHLALLSACPPYIG